MTVFCRAKGRAYRPRVNAHGYERRRIHPPIRHAQGHEFLDTLRDPEIWRRTKQGAKKIGSASIDVLFTLGKAYAKELMQEKLGIHLP